MSRSKKHLDALAQLLERTGGDAQRTEAVHKTQAFRRSWVELARCLHEVRKRGRFTKWGFSDFYRYCDQELTLKRATVDKLLLSYSTLHRMAPRVLDRDGVAQALPHLDSVTYLAKALERHEPEASSAANQGEPREPALQALSKAIFDEQRPLRELKREFNPILFSANETPDPKKRAQRSLAAIRRLKNDLLELEMLGAETRARIDEDLSVAQDELHDWLAAQEEQTAPEPATMKA